MIHRFLRRMFWMRYYHPGCGGEMEPCGSFYICKIHQEATANVQFRSMWLRRVWKALKGGGE